MRFRDDLETWLNGTDFGNLTRCTRDTGPVTNWRVHQVVRTITMTEILWKTEGDPDILRDFTCGYRDWILGSSAFGARGLKRFDQLYYTNGVTQGYDIFLREYAGRRFRVFKGEYPYTALSGGEWAYVEDEQIHPNDAVVMSVPFYATGRPPHEAEEVLETCAALGVPVFVDAAYFGTCYGASFDYGHPAISMVGFSLSKAFAIQSFRVGLLLSRVRFPCLDEIQVYANYFNKVGAYVGMHLMDAFSADYMPNTYRLRHQEACYALGLVPSGCIMLGNVREDDDRFDDLLRDDRFAPVDLPPHTPRRVGISDYISDRAPPLKKAIRRVVGLRP
jgi:hypothetical protein